MFVCVFVCVCMCVFRELTTAGGLQQQGLPVLLTACRVTPWQGSWEPEWQGSLWSRGTWLNVKKWEKAVYTEHLAILLMETRTLFDFLLLYSLPLKHPLFLKEIIIMKNYYSLFLNMQKWSTWLPKLKRWKKIDSSDSEPGMVVGARWGISGTADLLGFSPFITTEVWRRASLNCHGTLKQMG